MTRSPLPAPRTGFAYLDEVLEPGHRVLAMAHRGGAAHPDLAGLENTTLAFRHARDLGYRYLETDVHASSDGVLFALHDAVLDRVADRVGSIAEMRATDLELARVGGREAVPTLAGLLEEFPDCRFNIDIKAAAAVEPLVDLLRRTGDEDRVCVGAFDRDRIAAFRRGTAGRVATGAAASEAMRFLAMRDRRAAARWARGRFAVLQLPRKRGPIPVVTAPVVRRAHAAGVHVHVWTVDAAAHQRRMIDAGVDGIFTDRTDVLKDVLRERGLWREPDEHEHDDRPG
ncbi:MAG: glycerophosphodiester phosphodiesterase family protein [Marmoricola sp.]